MTNPKAINIQAPRERLSELATILGYDDISVELDADGDAGRCAENDEGPPAI